MKPAPAPNVPGNTPAERISNALRMVLAVSKEDLLKEERKWKAHKPQEAGKAHENAHLTVGLSRRFQA